MLSICLKLKSLLNSYDDLMWLLHILGSGDRQEMVDLSVVGGYEDERSISKALSRNLIKWLFKSG